MSVNAPAHDEAMFEQFWAACPRKDQRPKAWREWQRARARGSSPSQIIAAMQQYAESVQGTDEQYVQMPGNWLLNTYDPSGQTPPPRPRTPRTQPQRLTPVQRTVDALRVLQSSRSNTTGRRMLGS